MTVTGTDWPGASVPLGGLKVTPVKSLLADQLRSPCEPEASAKVSVQIPLPLLSGEQVPPPLAVNAGALQLHDTSTEFPPDIRKESLRLAGHTTSGIVIFTCACCPPDRVPLDGLY